ncbi:predicted protein [Uncinocarpus reesii 1704]|uniref:Uncharacterized protein n=1 Tax=Uncinocarpus reesii (strain UAMH 1704) TaxID=336963 RepID=C4JRD3_UNCRE|nr:uncharacterized protein UREG_05022 [Uncinocarpus reesii 1704]EEP80180.1 predicted protein [Uncinocarpus reesii 1704]
MAARHTIAAFLGIIAVCSIIIALASLLGIATGGLIALNRVWPGLFSLFRRRGQNERSLEEGLATEENQVNASGNAECQRQTKQTTEPTKLNWAAGYPAFAKGKKLSTKVQILATGSGLGPGMIRIAPLFPDTVMAVFDSDPIAVGETNSRIMKLRDQFAKTSKPVVGNPYQNISAFLMVHQAAAPNYFTKGQLSKVFVSIPSQESVLEKSPSAVDISQSYASVTQSGGVFYALFESEDALQRFAGEFDIAGHLWLRVPEEEWTKDCMMAAVGDRMKEGSMHESRIAVWKRK